MKLIVRDLEPVRAKLAEKDNHITTKVAEGEYKIVSGNIFFLKNFFKREIGFSWDPNENYWSMQITDEHTEESIDRDVHELAQEWGYTVSRAE